MRIALLSDIHANLPALDAVLRDLDARFDVDATYHLGDLVGYAPWPNEVVSRIRERGIAGVAGNYDSTVALRYKHCGCRYEDPRQEALSHESYEWTLRHTSDDSRVWLGALPFRVGLRPLGGHAAGPTVTLLHGNETLNTVYVTQDRPDPFLARMGAAVGARPGDAICVGHTHVAWHSVVDDVHYVNAGSVGRPKDGDWRAGYTLLDVTAESVSATVIRVEYDVRSAERAILASGLPDEFAWYLRSGGRSLEPTESAPTSR